ncbi:MAG: ABC transporter permease [Thermoplasmata archaeon]|nr:ABC transporter permease [Thermoplasmata archaeon]
MGANANASEPPLNVVPSISQVFRLARYQLRDYLRSSRYLLMMGLVGIIGLILTAVVGYFRPTSFLDTPLDFYTTMWGSGVTIVIVFAGVIFGGDAIAGEFQNKTGYFLMGLPLRRPVIYVGKYIAALVASFSAIVVFLLILLANGLFYFGADGVPWQLGPSFVLATIYLLALLGATFMFSSMFKTSTYATLVVAVLFLFGFSLLQALVDGLAHVTPWFIISYADTTIGAVLSTTCANQPGSHTCMMPGPGGRSFETMVTNPTIPQGLLIMLGYFVVTTVLGLLIFEREEFT